MIVLVDYNLTGYVVLFQGTNIVEPNKYTENVGIVSQYFSAVPHTTFSLFTVQWRVWECPG